MSMQRKPLVTKITFTASANGVAQPGPNVGTNGQIDVSQFAFGGLHVSSGLNNRVVNFIDNGEWGAEVVLQKTVATGFVPFTQDDLLRISPSMQLTMTLDSPATGTLWLKCKS